MRGAGAAVTVRAIRVLLGGMVLLLVAPAAQGDLRGLGNYGPTCPAPSSLLRSSGARLRIDPSLAWVMAARDAPMPVAPGRRAYVAPIPWPVGAPPIVAFVGHDPGSLAVVRGLPAGTPVYVLPSEGEHGREALGQACRACRFSVAGTAGARQLGIRAVPAVVRVVEGVVHVTEGVP
jgi:hypothetical protein